MRSYLGLIGNGETAALVGPDLSIGWLCLPRFDSAPLFAGALDPERGGSLTVSLRTTTGEAVALQPRFQRYRGNTALLETSVSGEGWRVETLDYMPWGHHCLVRELTVTNLAEHRRAAALVTRVAPVTSVAFPVAQESLTLSTKDAVVRLALPDPALVEFDPGETRRVRILIGYGKDTATAGAALSQAAGASALAEESYWSRWLATATAPDDSLPAQWRPLYWRSLVVLKLLSYERTGALLAAPTASFPATPGGSDNWDYRYCWLRDGYYTALALDSAGLHAEARRFYDFAFSLQEADGHWKQPLYAVDGADPVEFVPPDLCGPGGAFPLRFGNAASGQLQLDNEGNILHGLWFHYKTTGDRSVLEHHWDGVRRACNWTALHWQSVESGIWELREYQAHWVHGKAMCYAALTAGANMAEELNCSEEAAAWRFTAAQIRAEVVERGWNEERQAYLRHYGADAPAPCVDISVLALVFYGLLSPHDPRILSTVALMERDQSDGGLFLYHGFCRYDYAAVPFYLPTLWLARYYLMARRLDDCLHLLQTCVDCATDLGLMAEHFDGRTHTQWGNFPQAFSHEELVRLLLEVAQGWSFHTWDQPAAGSTHPSM